MKKGFTKFLLLLVILFSGYGNFYGHFNDLSDMKISSAILIKRSAYGEKYLDKRHSFETFKRKACFLDNEDTEENFSTIQKQLVKNNYFLNFLSHNKLAVYSVAFTKKVNDCKIFNLLSNKVYLLFQVFRI
ncbi:hypothetical protein ACEN2I_06185 [Flavobacterium sp. W22_SRS_FK3]|uniref:hypothetical protein n=1 Tax=Flavobacterium sp. W22_SRS_FK3 TaxID=3240275 RepID=UPI003F904FDD